MYKLRKKIYCHVKYTELDSVISINITGGCIDDSFLACLPDDGRYAKSGDAHVCLCVWGRRTFVWGCFRRPMCSHTHTHLMRCSYFFVDS